MIYDVTGEATECDLTDMTECLTKFDIADFDFSLSYSAGFDEYCK